DINVVTTTREARSNASMLPGLDAASGVKLAAVALDRVAGLYVTNPGGSLLATAGRDMNLVGAEVKSGGDASLSAVRDLNLDSVTTGRAEDIRWSGRNSREGQQSQESGTTVSGTGNVSLIVGRDLTGRAATLSAGEALSLEAGDRLSLIAGENGSSAETHHATKRGMTKYSLDADSQDTTLARTTLNATNIQLRSGGDMALSAIETNAQSLDIDAGGKLSLLTQFTTSAMSRKEVDNDAAFSSSSGSGRKDETSQYNRFNVKDLSIQAGSGVKAQLGQNDALSSLAQQPGMAWVNRLANDPAFVNSVQWQRVKEEHDRWSYHQSGMGPVTALVVSVVAAAVAAPMAAQAGAAAGGAATSAGMSATVSVGVSGAVQMGVSALASRASVSLANNDGDLGKVLKELGSSESIKAIATSMLTAGVIEGLGASGLLPQNVANATNGSARFTDQLQRQLIDNAAGAVVRSAVNGTSLEDELRQGLVNALLNTVAAQGANEIGHLTANETLNAFAGEAAHAIVGCAVGAGRAGHSAGCAPGAVGAVVGHLTAQFVNPTGDQSLAPQTLAASQLMAALAGAIVGADEQSMYIASSAGVNAAENNWLSGQQQMRARRATNAAQIDYWAHVDAAQQRTLDDLIAAKDAAATASTPEEQKTAYLQLQTATASASSLVQSLRADGDSAGAAFIGRQLLGGTVAMQQLGGQLGMPLDLTPEQRQALANAYGEMGMTLAASEGSVTDGALVTRIKDVAQGWTEDLSGWRASQRTPSPAQAPSPATGANAIVDTRKFTDYIFKPGADHGKNIVFESLGYSADDAAELSLIWRSQAAQKYAKGEFALGRADQYGQRVNIEIVLPGKGEASGQTSYLQSGWMVQSDGSLKLNTPFSGFTRSRQ
ncbi:DUF637 domain-containing protein, partial [Variovorax sp. JS1663]|uniref:DUF637 domain-containing protein n=1 Tax=Variovorax sp. JS1663 TaxID=1851577 RepID=UPI00186434CA